MSRKDDIQVQKIPVDINPESETALKQVIELAKQNLNNVHDLEERLKRIEDFINN